MPDKSKSKRKRSDTKVIVKKVKRLSNNVPNPQEVEELLEAETSFHSSLFKMEVEELLKEVKPQVLAEKLTESLEKLEFFLLNMPETAQSPIEDFPVGVKVPILKKIPTDKGTFKFLPPLKFLKIGSYDLGTVCSSQPVLDVAVEIPKSVWQKPDFLNERYHRKRALYLAYIAESLQKEDFVKSLTFTYQNDCHLKPVLLIVLNELEHISISLTAYPSEDAFKLTRFIPTLNNVRSTWMLKTDEDNLDIGTAYYNSTILSDILLPKLHSFLKDVIVPQNAKDGIILIKVWCMQRGLIMGAGRLNGFIISMFVAYLIKKQKINFFMNPYQVFRCFLLAFQHSNFDEGISLIEEFHNEPSLEDFQKHFPSVFIENSGFLNLLYSVSKETISLVKHEAKLGLQILDSELPNCFNLLFMSKISPLQRFEYLIHLKGSKKFRKYFDKVCDEKDSLNYGEDKVAAIGPKICNLLRRGLHNRILLVDFIKSAPSPWSICDAAPSPNIGQVTIGLLLNPEVPMSNLEKGPQADDPQAKEFREFWGDQSEMRRFQDGSIREAVFWSAETIEDKRKVFSQIVKDILKRHLSAKEKDIIVTGTEVDAILHLPKESLTSDMPPYGTGEEAHLALMQSFNALSKQLRSLDDLPLMISSIQGISSAFHFSEVFPPLPTSYFDKNVCFIKDSKLMVKENTSDVPPFTPALNVIISFEGSGKWPDDIEAIRRVKAAFLIKIANSVKSKYNLVTVPFLTHADIVKDGFVFRLAIACHKELFLMKQHRLPNGIIKTKETDESREFEIKTEILPKLNSILHGLHQQHNTFGTACRLAKRWMTSHLKYSYIHEVAVELLVAHCYCHPEPYTCPNSPQVAFLRFLSLIMRHDWKTSPLVINLNGELEKNEIEEMYSTFTAQRSTLPAMVISTPLDKRGNMFTKKKPHALILKRISMFAEATLNLLSERMFSMKDFDARAICRPAFELYDVIIHLKPSAIPKRNCSVEIEQEKTYPSLEAFNENVHKIYPVVEFDPALKYFNELKANFDEFAFFFYDIYGGDCIPVIWKRTAFSSKEFKVSHTNGCFFKDGKLVGNLASIFEDFKLLGNGIVEDIQIQKEL